jgi:hypothetical protein
VPNPARGGEAGSGNALCFGSEDLPESPQPQKIKPKFCASCARRGHGEST